VPAGYSGTPLGRKIGVKAGHGVVLADAPPGWTIDDLPAGVSVRRTPADQIDGAAVGQIAGSVAGGPADVVIAFVREMAELRERIGPLAESITVDGSLWVVWPRRAGGHTSDITDNHIREIVLPLGLVDVKVAALDNDWSGLKVVWRKERRAERRAQLGG
jgi:hypothetical protein